MAKWTENRKTTDKACMFCQTIFKAVLSEVKKGKAKYCSRSCVAKGTAKEFFEKHGYKKCSGKRHPRWNGGKADTKKSLAKWRKKNPEKIKAHKIVSRAKVAGRIKQEPCLFCGSTKSEAHHEDYNKPLNVVWLCRKHHREAHKNLE